MSKTRHILCDKENLLHFNSPKKFKQTIADENLVLSTVNRLDCSNTDTNLKLIEENGKSDLATVILLYLERERDFASGL